MPSDEQKTRQRLVGHRIRSQRESLRLTQGEVAARLDVDQAMISRYERGLAAPRPEHRRALETILGMERGEILRLLEPEGVRGALWWNELDQIVTVVGEVRDQLADMRSQLAEVRERIAAVEKSGSQGRTRRTGAGGSR